MSRLYLILCCLFNTFPVCFHYYLNRTVVVSPIQPGINIDSPAFIPIIKAVSASMKAAEYLLIRLFALEATLGSTALAF